MELLEDKKIFLRQRKNNQIKALAILIYHVGLSYRKTCRIIGELESYSHEALREWYTKCYCLFQSKKTTRHVIAIDETKIKKRRTTNLYLEHIDAKAKTIIAVHLFNYQGIIRCHSFS